MDNIPYSGVYGTEIEIQNRLISLGEVNITITDANDTGCITTLTVTPPSPCSTPCGLTATTFDLGCDNMGTPSGQDDTFSAIVTVFGENTSACFNYTINGVTEVGNYSTPIILTGLPANGGDVTMHIVDCVSNVCVLDVVLVVPEGCGTGGCELVCPDDIMAVDLGWGCNQISEVFNVQTSTNLTGEPQLTGGCNIASIAFVDAMEENTTTCGNQTINRTFTVVTEAGDTFVCVQQIHFTDNEAPAVSCATANYFDPALGDSLILYPVDVFECVATIQVPYPQVEDACASGWTVYTELVSLNGAVLYTLEPTDVRAIPDVPPGDYYLRYFVTDACGNEAESIDCRIRVQDADPPVAICVSGLDVSLGAFGVSRLYAEAVDNGSYDDCDFDRVEVRRIFNRDPATCDTLLTPVYSEWPICGY
ncbi:MAG: hypothetical protein R2795_19465 [Saprospiraceae bacterium]